MFKIIFLGLLSSVLANDSKAKTYSEHVPHTMSGSLNLTTGELKVFSGHAMNIIRSKCPTVDSDKIFQVTKYIGKLIAKTEPVPGASQPFKALVQTMTTCAKEGVIPKAPKEDTFRTVFYPFRHMKTLFFNHPKSEQDEAPEIEDTGVLAGFGKPNPEAEVPSTEAPTQRVIKTTIFVRPADMREGIRSSGGFFNWIHNVFSKIGGFFGHFLPFGMIRKKRDVSDSQQIQDLAEGMPATPTYQVYTPAKDESNGKRSFGQLIDQMCRLYCDTCSAHKEMVNFKLAAKELLTFLFTEDSGIELAAKKFLDKDFINSIEACE